MGAQKVLVAVVLVALILGFCCSSSNGSKVYNNNNDDDEGVFVAGNGAVASDVGECSRIGTVSLKHGGHAVDAAVATALCLGVVSGASSGIGGGSLMLLREGSSSSSSGFAHAYNMRETAPALASQNMYANNAAAKSKGPLSVAVPGELAGLYSAWLKYGKLPWKSLITPAISLAKNGFPVGPYLAYQINSSSPKILQDPGLRQVFSSNGTLLKKGEICRNPQLAKTLTAIARFGPKVFYNGSVGFNLVRDIQKAGGIIKMSDLQNYKVSITEPLSADIMGYTILGMPPPSSGGAGLILVLNILASYNSTSAVKGIVGIHRTIEALKHMYAIRNNLGDPDFVNVKKVVSAMLSPAIAAQLRKTIADNTTFQPGYYGIKWNEVEEHGTSHFCIVDKDKNAIAMTSTVNAYFGSGFLSPSTGIILNNEMDDFSIPSNTTSADSPPAAPANFIRPFKRPMSSMTPTIVLKDGQLKAVLGASGGSNIPAGTIEVFLNVFWKKMGPSRAVRAARLYHQLIPNVVSYENWTTVLGEKFEVSPKVLAGLKRRGHKLQGISIGAITQLIQHETPMGIMSRLIAVSDPRKAGIPSGY